MIMKKIKNMTISSIVKKTVIMMSVRNKRSLSVTRIIRRDTSIKILVYFLFSPIK